MSWLFCLIAVVSVGQWVTVDAKFSKGKCSWKLYPKTNIRGGILKPATTLTACQSACLAINGCVSVDWNPVAKGCWILYTQDGKESATDIEHYDYICSGRCPSGFSYLPLARSCYRVVYEALTWAAADIKCRQLHRGAHLVAIKNRNENNALKSYLQNQFAGNPGSTVCQVYYYRDKGNMIWTSGQRLDGNSCRYPFVWKLSKHKQLPFTFTDWNRREPNCEFNKEHCMHLASSWNYRWNDMPCSTRFCALCECLPD